MKQVRRFISVIYEYIARTSKNNNLYIYKYLHLNRGTAPFLID